MVSIGQEMYVSWQFTRTARRAHVTRVGRKYFYVSGERSAFEIATGRARSEYSGYAVTKEVHERGAALEKARSELERLGVNLAHGMKDEKVLAIREALAPLMPTQPSGDGEQR